MAFSNPFSTTDIETLIESVYGRVATDAEKATYVTLAATQGNATVETAIEKLPEASSIADPIIRLYQGAFGRVPDTVGGLSSGFAVNEQALRSGIGLPALAEAFVVSAEFQTLYGTGGSTVATPALIQAFYLHILNRAGSAAEVSAWMATGLDAAHVLLGFTQSTEFITSSQASVDNFKLALEHGQHPSGNLPPPPLALSLTSDHDVGGLPNTGSVDEGSTVTFLVQSTATSDFGKTFSYNISGIDASRIVGGNASLAGTVTLDAQGLAHVAVTVIADNKTDGPTTMTMAVGSLTDKVAVNDTSITPVTQSFTTTVGETLTGADGQNTTFIGTVDRTFIDQSTLSNIVDVAQGGLHAHNTEQILVQNNLFNTEIEPTANNVQSFVVTDRGPFPTGGSTFDLRFVPQIQDITELNSDASSTFHHVKNLVNVNLLNPDKDGVGITVKIDDTNPNPAGPGAVTVGLQNTGFTYTDVNIHYAKEHGGDIVTEFDFNVLGQNQDVDLDNTSMTKTVVINGGPGMLELGFDEANHAYDALTMIDASGYAGNLDLEEIGDGHGADGGLHNNLTVLGSKGTNAIDIDAADQFAVTVTTQDGAGDTVNVENQGAGAFNVTTGGGAADAVTIDEPNADSGAITVKMGDGNKDTAVVNAGNNIAADPAAPIMVTMGAGSEDAVTVNAGSYHAVTVTASGNDASITVNEDETTGSNSPVTVTANGGDADINIVGGPNSPITVTATGGGVQDISVDAQINSAINITTDLGNDNIVISGTSDELGLAWNNTANVSTGAGDDRVEIEEDTTGAFGALAAGMSFDGGSGTNTFAVTADVAHGGTNGASVLNFQVLEITDVLDNDVVVSDFVSGNHVVLDNGWSGNATVEGINSGVVVDITGPGDTGLFDSLVLDVTGAGVHPNDVVNLVLHGSGAGTDFGHVYMPNVENVHITADGVPGNSTATDKVELGNLGGQHITSLTLDNTGSHGLNLVNLFGGLDHVKSISAGTMTGNLTLLDGSDDENVTATLGSGADTLTLGNGNNQINLGSGGDTIHVGNGSNAIVGGASIDSIFFAAHTLTDTLVYHAASESAFAAFLAPNTPNLAAGDQLNGFNSGAVNNDKIDISAFSQNPFAFDGNVANANAALADIAGDSAGRTTAVYDVADRMLFIDVNGDHVLDAAHDMQIHVIGVPALNSSNFIV